jgi:hypothetical protein
MIELSFDESEFFDFFEFTNGDWDKKILSSLFGGRYGGYGYEIYDSSWGYEEWKEGYILRNINNENQELLKKIITIASPSILSFKEDEYKYYQSISKFLSDNFSRESGNITDNYLEQLNEGADKKIKNLAISELGDPFRNYGVIVKGNKYFRNYVTTVSILMSLYSLTGTDKNKSIKELFEKLGKSLDLNVGSYDEVGREAYEIDEESFNDVVKTNLEKVLEEIEENPEKYEGTRKYGEILQSLDKMGYEIGRYYSLPYDNKKNFRIDGINKENLRIILSYNDGKGFERRTYSLEEFNNFLQSPELFESLVKKLKKML